ncbi:uncharacterized protein M6B38_145615 [Iris pallida]|uniref:Uncharacterized protein n=1 Tax=Iris pallida TaxID=29817 RepID=A0AAX6F8F9_IRIPA|nr:uncharacterized protein M6B38_145615 [Iris pallida]
MTSPLPPAAAAAGSHAEPPPPPQPRPHHRLRPSLSLRRGRGRRMPTVRLGGRRGWRGGGRLVLRLLRRLRVQWVAAQYSRYVKRVRAYYSRLVRDIVEGAATMEASQARLLMETYFAVPVVPVAVTAAGNYYR